MNNILTLSSIDDSDMPKVGQRAVDLSKIHKAKMNAPISFVIPNIIYHEFIEQNNLSREVRDALNTPDKNEDDYADIYARIKTRFEYATVPKEFHEELLEAYETLNGSAINAQALLSEDEPVVNLIISPSYAMKAEGFTGVLLNIHGFENFLNSVKSSWLSLYTPEHLKRRDREKITDFTCGIIVQKFIMAETTTDAFSKSPAGEYEISLSSYFGLPDITGRISRDNYAVSRETFGIESQKINLQEHILLANSKSGTLIKRSLGRKGSPQKVADKNIFELARLVEKLSSCIEKHLRCVIFSSPNANWVFFVDRTGERNSEQERAEYRKNHSNAGIKNEQAGLETAANAGSALKETLSDMINSPVVEDTPEPAAKNEEAFAWETTINSNANPNSSIPPKAIILPEIPSKQEEKPPENQPGEKQETSKQTAFEENIDDFILAPATKPGAFQDSVFRKEEAIIQESSMIEKIQKNEEKPDDFYTSIILDLEPAIDQEIMKRYQQKFNEVPTEINAAMEKLSEEGLLPEKEQIFKLKNMKELLQKGETINLDSFLDITEKLRRSF